MLKRALSLILAISTMLLISAAPGSAAYAENSAEIKSSLTSSGLTLCELTGFESELGTGIYYLTENRSYTGADAVSSSEKGQPGLKIAEGSTVYIYIPAGVKLSCAGGAGYDAVKGQDADTATVTATKATESGIEYNRLSYYNQNAAKGGAGATGGGAGIYVPESASLVIIGEGSLECTGGAGGNGAQGGTGSETKYSIVSWYAPAAGTKPEDLVKEYKTNTCYTESWSGETTQATGLYEIGFHPGAGGGAGGAAAGGGAGIGGNGGNGSAGTAGGYQQNLWMNEYVTDIKQSSSSQTGESGRSGKIYLDIADKTLTGGAGGAAGTAAQAGPAAEAPSGKIYDETGAEQTETLYITHGQPGGAGGAGGNGAAAGTGGNGGRGGTGGDSGSGCDAIFDEKTEAYGISKKGYDGTAGTAGSEAGTETTAAEYPYNNIVFTSKDTQSTQSYTLKQATEITVPECTMNGFMGYTITKTAEALPECFGEEACELTESYESSGKIYQPGDKISATGICGDVEFTAWIITVGMDSWTYGDTPSEPQLTGSLLQGDISYSYYKDKSCTSPTDTAESGAEQEGGKPVNAGSYYVKATLQAGDKLYESSPAAFEIKPKQLTEEMLCLSVDGNGTDSAEYATGVSHTLSYELKDADAILAEGTDYTIDTAKSSALQQTAIGKYRLTVIGAGNYTGKVTKYWKITNTLITGVVTEEYNGEYDGQPHSITVDISASNVKDALISYAESENGHYRESPIEYTDAGEYQIYYKIYAQGFEYIIGTETVTITPKKVEVSLKASSKVYDGTAGETQIDASAESGVEGETLTISGISGSFEDKNAGKDKKLAVDKSAVTLTVAGGSQKPANYELVIPEYTSAEIYKKQIIVSVAGKDREYDGSSTVEITGTIPEDSGVIEGDEVGIADGNGLMKDPDAGTNKPVNVTELYFSGADGSNYQPYYPLSATVNISPKDISGATVILKGQVPVEDGTAKTQEVEKVILPGYENVSFTTSENEQTAAGIYSLTVTGTGNFTGSVTKTYTVKEANPGNPVGTSVITGYHNGIINLQIENNTSVPQLLVNSGGNEAETAMAGAEEHSRVADGETLNLKIKTCPVTESDLDRQTQEAIKYAVGSKELACYMDISLYKQFDGDEKASEYHETYSPLSLTLVLPLKMHPADRTYYLVRYYNASATLIPSEYNEDTGTLSFNCDSFGVFALCYTEPESNGGGATATGDSSELLLWTAICFAGITGLVLVIGHAGKKKKSNG